MSVFPSVGSMLWLQLTLGCKSSLMEITEQKSLFPVPICLKSVEYVEITMGKKQMTFSTQMERWKQTQPALATVGRFTTTPGRTPARMSCLTCWLCNDQFYATLLWRSKMSDMWDKIYPCQWSYFMHLGKVTQKI